MATLSGFTRNQALAPISGVDVKVFRVSNDAYIGTGTSDATGRYTVTTPDAGPFYVVARTAGPPVLVGVSAPQLTALTAIAGTFTKTEAADGLTSGATVNQPSGTETFPPVPGKTLLATFAVNFEDGALTGAWPNHYGSQNVTPDYPGSGCTIVTSPARGTRACRSIVDANNGLGVTPKASLQRRVSGFQTIDGDITRTYQWCYIVGAVNLAELYFWDYENVASGSQGMRMKWRQGTGVNSIATIDREFTSPRAATDNLSVPVPRDRWFRLTIEVLYRVTTTGYVKIWYDDTTVAMNLLNVQTLINSGANTYFDQIEAGLTANGAQNNAVTMYWDDHRTEFWR